MNQLTRDVMDRIYTGYKTQYNKGLATVKTQYLKYCEVVASDSPIEKYPMVSLTGGMRKWIGPRVVNRMTGKIVTITNDDYEDTLGIPANDLRYDKLSIYNGRFVDMGIVAGNLWDKLAVTQVLSNPLWCDGKPFFVANRTIDDKDMIIINNLVALGFSFEAYSAGRKQMMAFCDATGEPLELVPDLLMVGPKYEESARSMLLNETIIIGGVAVTNPYRNPNVELIVNGRFIGDYEDQWRLMCTSRGVKPFVVQKVFESGLVRKDSATDDNMFNDNEAVYGLHSIGAAGPGLPQLCIGGIPAPSAGAKKK